MKDTLRLKIICTWINIRANSFIKALVNNMKRRSTKVLWTSFTRKNAMPHFKEHCTKIDISLNVIRFFFSQTNLVFKSNPLFIDIMDSFCHNLFTFLPFNFYLYSTGFEVYSMPLRLFYNNQWSFDQVQYSFCEVFIVKMLLCHPWKNLTC